MLAVKCPKCQKNNAVMDKTFGAMWCDDCNSKKSKPRISTGIGGNVAQAVFEDSQGRQYTTNEKGNILANPKFYKRKYKAKTIYL